MINTLLVIFIHVIILIGVMGLLLAASYYQTKKREKTAVFPLGSNVFDVDRAGSALPLRLISRLIYCLLFIIGSCPVFLYVFAADRVVEMSLSWMGVFAVIVAVALLFVIREI